MGDQNTKPRRINGVEGELGQLMQSQGPGVVEQWTNPSDIGVDYGLSFIGTVTGIAGAPKFQCSGLIGFGNAFFNGYWAYVVWDAGGGGVQPQGQKLICTGYSSVDADFTVAAFAPNVIAVGDKVLFMHPNAVQARTLLTMDFWSLPQEEVALTVAAGDKALPSVTVADLPGTVTIVRAIAMFKFRMVENHTYAGENSLDGAQVIQVATSVPAINFVTGQFTIAETTREGGDVVIGIIDIAATVNANGAYAFHWDDAKALQTGINFNDVQMGIRIWYSV